MANYYIIYSLDFASYHFYFFPWFIEALCGERFLDDDVKAAVPQWLHIQVAAVFKTGIALLDDQSINRMIEFCSAVVM